MCLCLPHRNKQRPPVKNVYVYKVYDKAPVGYKSIYRDMKVKPRVGRFIRSDREKAAVSLYERSSMMITLGLHAYSTLAAARSKKATRGNRGRIARFVGHPEDFVARGTFGRRPSIVFTKLRFDGWEDEIN